MSEQNNLNRNELEAKIIAKAWQDEAFKQELLDNSKAVFSQEIGHNIPDGVEIRVVEENPNTIYLVLPMKPTIANGEELPEEQLEAIAGGFIDFIFKTVWGGFDACGS